MANDLTGRGARGAAAQHEQVAGLPTLQQAMLGREANMAGQNGVDHAQDTEIVHAMKGEIVLPPISGMDPATVKLLRAIIKGGLEKRTVGHPATNKNPVSGLDAFFEGAEGVGADDGPGPGDTDGTGEAGGDDADSSDAASATAAANAADEAAAQAQADIALDIGLTQSEQIDLNVETAAQAVLDFLNIPNPLDDPVEAIQNTIAKSIMGPISVISMFATPSEDTQSNPTADLSDNSNTAGPADEGAGVGGAQDASQRQTTANATAAATNPVQSAVEDLRNNPFAFFPDPSRRSAVHQAQPGSLADKIIGARS